MNNSRYCQTIYGEEINNDIPHGIVEKPTSQWVISYDNGSGYREWACQPQPTWEEAWAAAGLKPGEEIYLGSETQCEQV